MLPVQFSFQEAKIKILNEILNDILYQDITNIITSYCFEFWKYDSYQEKKSRNFIIIDDKIIYAEKKFHSSHAPPVKFQDDTIHINISGYVKKIYYDKPYVYIALYDRIIQFNFENKTFVRQLRICSDNPHRTDSSSFIIPKIKCIKCGIFYIYWHQANKNYDFVVCENNSSTLSSHEVMLVRLYLDNNIQEIFQLYYRPGNSPKLTINDISVNDKCEMCVAVNDKIKISNSRHDVYVSGKKILYCDNNHVIYISLENTLIKYNRTNGKIKECKMEYNVIFINKKTMYIEHEGKLHLYKI